MDKMKDLDFEKVTGERKGRIISFLKSLGNLNKGDSVERDGLSIKRLR